MTLALTEDSFRKVEKRWPSRKSLRFRLDSSIENLSAKLFERTLLLMRVSWKWLKSALSCQK